MLEAHEIEMLVDGLDALNAKAGNSRLLSMMLGTLMAKSQEEASTYLNELNVKAEIAKVTERPLEESIILLKAKLIRMKGTAIAEGALEELGIA